MHVLVVDDDTRLRELLKKYLSENGFRVTVANDAAAARATLRGLTFDLIVLDVMMPGENGFDLTASLKTVSSVPILLLTAMGEPDDRVAGLEQGADDYLTKPFDMRELAARMDAILRRAEPDPDKTLRVGPLNVNIGRHTAEIDGRALSLSPKEFAILEILCQRRGEALHKEAIMGHLYGGMDVPAAKIVDVFVCKLRKKLQAASEGGIQIDTVWGFGYVLRFRGTDSSAGLPKAA